MLKTINNLIDVASERNDELLRHVADFIRADRRTHVRKGQGILKVMTNLDARGAGVAAHRELFTECHWSVSERSTRTWTFLRFRVKKIGALVMEVMPNGQWSLVALSVGANQTVMYMDNGTGLVSATNSPVADILLMITELYIGADPAMGIQTYWNGGMGEVAVYKRALSPGEIGYIHNTLPKRCASTCGAHSRNERI